MRLSLEMSASTIRVYFKKLVDEGILKQLHISSGRVPTDQALAHYWNDKLKTDEVMDLISEESVKSLANELGIYCLANFTDDINLDEVISVADRYIMLLFGDVQVTYEYNEYVYNYLKSFVGTSAKKISQLCFSVGLVKLSSKIENAFEFEKNFSVGKIVLYEMLSSSNIKMSLDEYEQRLENRSFLDLANGLYFEKLVPQGYMLLKQDVNIENKRANLTCIGNLCSDFESFFDMARV
jgi:heat-inducible transcriptional repressor